MAIQERRIITSYQRPSTRQAEDIYRRASHNPRAQITWEKDNGSGSLEEVSGVIPYWIHNVKLQLRLIGEIRKAERVTLTEPISFSPRDPRRLGK